MNVLLIHTTCMHYAYAEFDPSARTVDCPCDKKDRHFGWVLGMSWESFRPRPSVVTIAGLVNPLIRPTVKVC